jgi:hypothetical protein
MSSSNNHIFENAAENGNLEEIKFLFASGIEGYTIDTVEIVVYYGHLNIFKWLHENNKIMTNTADQIMVIVLNRGHLEIAKYMIKNFTLNRSTFLMSALSGTSANRTAMVKWAITHALG